MNAFNAIVESRLADYEKDASTILTLRKIAEYINTLSEEDKDKPLQILKPEIALPGPDRLIPALRIGKVSDFGCETRSVYQFTHNPDDIVILVGSSPYSEDGDTAYFQEGRNLIGNRSGKEVPLFPQRNQNRDVFGDFEPETETKSDEGNGNSESE